MLMTKDRQLTELGELILDAIRKAGGWQTRRQIAQAIGRPRKLTEHDIAMLNQLVSMELVETDKRKIGVVLTEFVYRAKK